LFLRLKILNRVGLQTIDISVGRWYKNGYHGRVCIKKIESFVIYCLKFKNFYGCHFKADSGVELSAFCCLLNDSHGASLTSLTLGGMTGRGTSNTLKGFSMGQGDTLRI